MELSNHESKRVKFIYCTFAIVFALQSSLPAQEKKHADLVVINANIRTMVTPDTRAEALAVSGDRITKVGTNKLIKTLIGPSTRVIDARGRLVLPGFNDAHVHFTGIGNTFSSLNLSDTGTADEMLARLRRYTSFLPKGRWILGGLWNGSNTPDRKLIDEVSPANPVFLYHVDGRSAIANSLAFERARLKSDSAGVDGNESGQPTGVVRGDALARIRNVVPADHTRNWAEIAETATNYAASLGVTSVQDMHSDDLRDVYRQLERAGKLKTRIYDCISLPDWRKLVSAPDRPSALVRGGCLKSFADGDDTSRSRLLRDVPYADKAGYQIMLHAIGERSNDNALQVFEETVRLNGRRDRRFRLEHAHDPRPEDLPRFGTTVVASMQPYLFNNSPGGYYSRLLKQRSKIAFGSDAMIVDLNPLLGIQAAVTAGEESITVYEAIRGYTAGSAYAEFQDEEKGTLEPGKLADFVVLSDDIFSTEPRQLRETLVLMTVVGGTVVFDRNIDEKKSSK